MELKDLLNKAVKIANDKSMETFFLGYNKDHQWAVFTLDNVDTPCEGRTPEEALLVFIGCYGG